MAAWRYKMYLLVSKLISHEWASIYKIEDKFKISAQPCIILYIFLLNIVLQQNEKHFV